jgi:RNA polymerase sigma-70 factor, ECF subfamily
MSVSISQVAVNAIQPPPIKFRTQAMSEERSLVSRAKSGHRESFGVLYERHQMQAYRTALNILRNPHDAEDAVQHAFQQALVHLERFREDSSFATWLTRIVMNQALMMIRQRRVREPRRESETDIQQPTPELEIADAGPTPEEIFCERERRAALFEAVGQLRKKLRVVVVRGELQGQTSAETAKLLGLTVTAVKARTFHARRSLRKALERKFEPRHSRLLYSSKRRPSRFRANAASIAAR